MGQKEKEMKSYIGIGDLVDIRLHTDFEGYVSVSFDPKDPSKNVVIDEDALKKLNATLSERLAGHTAHDPNVIGFLKEYCEKWLTEFHQLGYVVLEDVEDKD